MGETVMFLLKEGFDKLTILILCVADNRYPPLGSAIYYSLRHSKSLAKNTLEKVRALFKRH